MQSRRVNCNGEMMQSRKNKPTRSFLFPGRIFRVGYTQAIPGGPTEPTERDIVPSTRFARADPESREEYKAGTQEGREWTYLYFRNPGYGLGIRVGDKAIFTIDRELTVWNIDRYLRPDTGKDDHCIEVSRLIAKAT